MLFDSSQDLSFRNRVSDGHFDLSHFPRLGGKDKCVHLHGFNRQQMVVLLNLLADLRDDGDDPAGERAWNFA